MPGNTGRLEICFGFLCVLLLEIVYAAWFGGKGGSLCDGMTNLEQWEV